MFRSACRMAAARAALCVVFMGPGAWALDDEGDRAAAEDPAPTPERGRALIDASDFEGAEKVFAALVAGNPADGPSWFHLGYARHARGAYRSALEAHAKAAEFPGLRARALYNAACSRAKLGETDAALEALRGAVAAGFRGRALLADDGDFTELRKDPRFAAVLRPLLRGAAAFVEPVRVIRELHGDAAGDEFGWVAREVGDLDGDGALDFAVTAPGARGRSGRVSVWSSRAGKLLFSVEGARGDGLGNIVAPAGDVDGDGTGDLIAGAPVPQAPGQAAPRAGYVVLLSGKTGAVLRRIEGEAPGDQFGLKACGVGDVDGDGRADVAVSAWLADAPETGGADAGCVTIHSGATGAVITRIRGDRAGDRFGSAVDSASHAGPAGTVRLLAVGAMDAGPGRRGQVRVLRLSRGGAETVFTADAAPTGADFGQYFVAFAGDCDGDGVPDVLASDFADAANGPATGRCVVISGKDGKRIADIPGARAGDAFGTSRSVCGDADGDGSPDAIIGAWQCADGAPSGGLCSLVSLRDGRTIATWTSRMDQDTLGFDAVGLGDVDGDGGTDFLLSAAWSEIHGPRTGRVWVVAGPVPARREGPPK
ncbi:MAG: hypothetical protein HMLKMBBP_00070 [Planctomycetes bacterium]|nr:hypothetical protein [Planctomycetota bacterium]